MWLKRMVRDEKRVEERGWGEDDENKEKKGRLRRCFDVCVRESPRVGLV